MTTHHDLIDELRSFIHSSDQTLTDGLKDLAAQYAAACREVNQRLGRCLDNLKRGLRSEAIHLAQAEPVLLDVLSALDFPERPQWDEIAALYGLPAAPALNIDAAKALNEAYAEEKPLEDLLKRHRLLALARAPLAGRLMILRRIASLDALNPVWLDDVREFEKTRLRQMHQEVEDATKRGDTAAVAALAEEVRGTRWEVELPAGLMHHLDAVARQHTQSKAMKSLLKSENDLTHAINAFDVARARRLGEEIHGLVKAAALRPGDPVLERVSASLAWIEEQDCREAAARQHEKAERLLERALDESASREELELQFRAMEKSGRGLSAPLEARYQARIKELTAAAERKLRLLRIGAVAAAVLAVVLVSWLVYRSALNGRVSVASEAVRGHLNARNFTDAKGKMDDLKRNDSAVYDHPDFAPVREEFQRAERADESRRLRLENLLAQLGQATDWKQKEDLAERLQSLVRTPADERCVRDALRKWEEDREREAAAWMLKAHSRIDDLNRNRRELEQWLDKPGQEAKAFARLHELEREAGMLEGEVKGRSNELHQEVRRLQEGLGRVRKELTGRQGQEMLLQDMTGALLVGRTAEPYTKLVHEYVKQFPGSPRAKSFRLAAAEKHIWEGTLVWQQLLAPNLQQPLNLATAQAKALAEKCDQFLKDFPQFPDLPTATAYHRALAALALRDHDNKSGAVEDLRRLFSDTLVQNVTAVKMVSGSSYYVLGDAHRDIEQHRKAGVVLLKSVADFTGKRKDVSLKTADIRQAVLSRQSVLAGRVQAWLPRVDKSWEATLVDIAQELVKDEEMDAVLRVKLLDRVLDIAARGSYPLGLALAEHRGHLKKSNVDTTVLWMWPDNLAANAMRPRALKAARALPSLTGVLKEAEAYRRDLIGRIGATRLELAGFLVKEESSGWQCRAPLRLPKSGELVAAVPQGEDQSAAWQVVGKVEGGKAVIDRASPALLEGRLVFVRTKE